MISRQEYHERLKRLQQKVKANDLDAFLVTSQESIYYLTGVTYVPLERPFFLLVRPDTPSIILAPALDQEHLKEAPNVEAVRRYWDYPSPPGEGWPELLADLLGPVQTLGVEPTLPQEIADRLADVDLQTQALVEALRLIKSPDELAMLRQASRYADLGMQKIIKSAYRGVSEIEIFSQARAVQLQIIRETDFDPLNTSVLTAAWPARLGTQPHGVPELGDRLETGPHIALSFMRVNGYGAECERTFFVTAPDAAMKDMYAAMLESRSRAYAMVRPGVACAEIDREANGFLRRRGLGDYLLHRTGHGFGLGNHEPPWVAEGSSDTLEENMLISIEPGIYVPGLGGFRHSDTVLVTEDGYERLTHFPDDIDSLTLKRPSIVTRVRGTLLRKAVGI
jgi:Xaa-Pro aminopeptidase